MMSDNILLTKHALWGLTEREDREREVDEVSNQWRAMEGVCNLLCLGLDCAIRFDKFHDIIVTSGVITSL